MRLAVLQPSYLPWLGYFDQIARVDQFVFYDDVQYDKNGWRNRNRIKTDRGWQWITVPVLLTGNFGAAIKDVQVNPTDPWRRKHWGALKQWYAKAPHFGKHAPFFEEMFAREWKTIADLSIFGVAEIARRIGLKTALHRSSELGVAGDRNERLLNLCRHFGATEYLSGDAAKEYLDEKRFTDLGIRVIWHGYVHPTYPQLHGEFQSHLSIVDLLFNCGPDSARILCNEPSRVPQGAA